MLIKKEKSNAKEKDIKIRYATKEDSIALQRIFNKVVREKRFLPYYEEIDEIDDRWLNLRNQNLIIVAEVGNEVVGLVQLERSEFDASTHVGIIGIIVDPDHRGTGVGSALLKWTIDTAKSLGFEKICLQVFHTNSIAIALYKKFGFKSVGRRKKQFKINENEYVDEILMERFLT
jgi:RimJ/RimL family protein N-acetyltransferase